MEKAIPGEIERPLFLIISLFSLLPYLKKPDISELE